jgi:hypothetical protein
MGFRPDFRYNFTERGGSDRRKEVEMQKLKRVFWPCRRAAVTAFILFFVPQIQVLASDGAGLPFDDPAWKTLIGLALIINGFLYFLVWRRQPN